MAQIAICFSNEQHPLFEGDELWAEIFAHGVVMPEPSPAPPPPAPPGEPIAPTISGLERALLGFGDDPIDLLSRMPSKVQSDAKLTGIIANEPATPSSVAGSTSQQPQPPPSSTQSLPRAPHPFPEPYQFVLCQLHYRYSQESPAADSMAIFDLDSGELTAFNESFERLVDCPIQVLDRVHNIASRHE